MLSTSHTISPPDSQNISRPKNWSEEILVERVADAMRGKLNPEKFVATFRSKTLKRSG